MKPESELEANDGMGPMPPCANQQLQPAPQARSGGNGFLGLGTVLAAIVAKGKGLQLHSKFFLSLAYVGFFLNLFNLVPFGFLDGGRIARVISRKAWIVGALLLGLLMLRTPSPMLFLIVVMGGVHALRSQHDPALDLVTDIDRRLWSQRYFGLCAFLGLCVLLSHRAIEAHYAVI